MRACVELDARGALRDAVSKEHSHEDLNRFPPSRWQPLSGARHAWPPAWRRRRLPEPRYPVPAGAARPPVPGAPAYVEYGRVANIEVLRSPDRRGSGTTGGGAVVGGVVGGVLGNQIGHGGGRAAATALGAVGGALLGNAIEANNNAPRVHGLSRHGADRQRRLPHLRRAAPPATCAWATACASTTAQIYRGC